MEECVRQAIAVCPDWIQEAVARECERPNLRLEELRVRAGRPIHLFSEGREWRLCRDGPLLAEAKTLQQIVSRATDHALYAAEDRIRQGFCTLPGGHRLGICGSLVPRTGEGDSMQAFSSGEDGFL